MRRIRKEFTCNRQPGVPEIIRARDLSPCRQSIRASRPEVGVSLATPTIRGAKDDAKVPS